MKKILALLLFLSLVFTTCVPQNAYAETPGQKVIPFSKTDFTGLSDPALLRYVEDSVYSNLIQELDNDSYFVENVSAIYVSKEYLDELAYNSQANIYFGYTLSELEDQFQGTRYIFTLGENGQTVVQEFEKYDDTYDKVLRNVAIGTGVILLCVTVSVVTAAVGATAVSVIFAASAETAAKFALSGGVFSAVTAGIVTGIQTKDFDKSFKAAALAGSDGFKWGAITGTVFGGAEVAIALKGATLNGLTMNEAVTIQKSSKLPLSFIKNFKSVDEYNIYQKAGLVPKIIDGKEALVRSVSLDSFVEYDEFGVGITNADRIKKGFSPLDEMGQAYELHHIGQKVDSPLAILTKSEHISDGNFKILHKTGNATEAHALGTKWQLQVRSFWADYLKQAQGGL